MSQIKNRLGPKVVGEEVAAAEAAAEAATMGHQHTLGPRVTGVTGAPAVYGERVASAESHHRATSLAVDEITRLLGENGTFFDSFYVAELHRSGGPRIAALRAFLAYETSIIGQQRVYIIDEIRTLLGEPATGQTDSDFVKSEIDARRIAHEEKVKADAAKTDETKRTETPPPAVPPAAKKSGAKKSGKSGK